MKLAIAALLAAASPSISYADVSSGIVESVRETQLRDERQGFPGVLEHALRPRLVDELLVRLDDGHAVTVVETGMKVFAPGQRVLIVSDRSGALVEHADRDVPVFQP